MSKLKTSTFVAFGAAALAASLAGPVVKAAGPTITVFGCIQREADYLRGGRANPTSPTVVGTSGDHELVLVYASTPTEVEGDLLGTSGRSYQLTGPSEIQLEQYLGQRVQLTGILQMDPIGTNGPSGGPHQMVAPHDQLLTASLVDLRVLEVLTAKTAIGACPVS